MKWVVLVANRVVGLEDCIHRGFLLQEGESKAGLGIFPFLFF